MINFFIPVLAALLLVLLLYHEKKENRKSALLTKTFLSLLFILTAVIQPHPLENYYFCLLVGLILCLVGDVCLALPEKFFRAGLAAFLLGHGFYIWSFMTLADIGQWLSPGAMIFVAVSAIVFFWLRPKLGALLGPVLIYIVVITGMVGAAWGVFWKPALPLSGRTLIFLGAISFYLSDLFVARNKFIKNEFLNRLIGLPLYYFGQFLLAFSPGMVG